MNDSPPMVIAHRTCALDAPENSLEGIRRSGELGAGAVELDVRLTRDRVPILMHDPTPHRTAGGRLAVRCTSSVRLQRLRLANGEPVPTLAGALAALALGPAGRHRREGRSGDRCDGHRGVQPEPAGTEPHLVTRHVDSPLQRRPRAHDRAGPPARRPLGLRHRAGLRDARACGARAISAHWGAITPVLAARVGRAGFEAVLLVPSAPPGPREAPGARRRGDRLADRGSGCDRVAPRRRVTALPARQQYSERHAAFRRSRRVHHAKTLRSSV